MKVVISHRAGLQLEGIRLYINQYDIKAAAGVMAKIGATIERLGDFPDTQSEKMVGGMRRAVVPRVPYVVIYKVRTGRIDILGVFHSARHPSSRTHI